MGGGGELCDYENLGNFARKVNIARVSTELAAACDGCGGRRAVLGLAVVRLTTEVPGVPLVSRTEA